MVGLLDNQEVTNENINRVSPKPHGRTRSRMDLLYKAYQQFGTDALTDTLKMTLGEKVST